MFSCTRNDPPQIANTMCTPRRVHTCHGKPGQIFLSWKCHGILYFWKSHGNVMEFYKNVMEKVCFYKFHN